MSDCFDSDFPAEDETMDPRLEQYVRCCPAENDHGAVMLVGVAHDHPSSVARVAHLLKTVSPDILALELPPLAVPLFRQYADDEYVPPRLGGEMSTAIQTADDPRIVGIDGPSATYFRLLLWRMIAERSSMEDIAEIVRDVTRGVGHALACRLGAVVGRLTPFTPKVYTHITYDCTAFDLPSTQARHERDHVAERRAFLRVVELPTATALIDEVREESMATRLTELRSTGDVVAIVGIEHLDDLAEQLGGDTESPSGDDRIDHC